MMYQPTNVTPSSLTGESTVDVADNVNITWQINGDVPLAAFQIDFYQNNAVSTKLYSTGLLTDNCPADGVDGQGKPILFSYQPSVPWSTYELTNGNDYKYKITQFWEAQAYVTTVPSFTTGGGNVTYSFYMLINGKYYYYSETKQSANVTLTQGDNITLNYDNMSFIVNYNTPDMLILPVKTANSLTDMPATSNVYRINIGATYGTGFMYLNQYSDNVFLTRTTPPLSINAFTEPLNKIVNTFTATYTQAEGDTVKWIKWVLTDNTQSVIVEDTGEISTYVFSYTYNGFMNGNNYTITCTAETENGVQVTASETFDVSYTMPEAEGTIKLSCNSDSSVTLSWAQASDINGLAIPESGYTINNNTLSVADGTRILWDTKNEEPLSIETPVSFAYKGYQKSFIEYKYDITLNTSMINPIIALNPQNTLMVAAAERTAELYSISESGATFLQKIYMDGLTTNFDGNINAVIFSPDGQYLVICGAFSSVGVVYEVSGNTLTFFDNIYSYVTSPTRCIDFTNNRDFLVSSTVESLEYYDVYKLSINDFGQRVDYIGSFSYAEMLTYIKSVPNGYLYSGESIIKGSIDLDNGTTITLTDNGTALTYPVTSAVYIGDNSEGYLIAKTSYMQGSSSYTKLIWYYYNGTTYSYFTTVDTDRMADGFEISAYNNFIFACDMGGLYEFRTDEIGNRLKNLTTFTYICPIYKDNNNTITDFPNEVIVNCTTSGNAMIATLDNQGTYTLKYYALNNTVSDLTIATTGGQILQRNIFNGISVMGQYLRGYSVYVPFGDFSEYIWQIYSTDNTIWRLRTYSIDNDTVNYMGNYRITGFLNPSVPWDIQALILNGVQTTDYLYVTSDYNYDITQNNYTPLFTANAQFYANFEDGLKAGTNTTAAGDYAVYREKNGTSLLPLGQLSTDNQKMKDYGVLNNNTYTYSMYYVDGDTYSTPLYSEGAVCQQFPAYVLMETTPDSTNSNVYHVLNVWCFGNNIEAQPVANGNEPNFLENFTQYPYRQGSCVMARSGVLSALLSNAKDGQYADTAEQMQRLDNISLSNNIFFLKDTKGNIYQVHTSSAITQTINITSSVQEVKITIPWQEVGSAENVSIIQLPTDEGWTEEEGSQSGIFKTQSKTVLLDMANSDQTVTPDTNYLLNSVTVRKPATLQPSNILKGVNIGGVIGTVEKDVVLQEKTVSVVPNEDMSVVPDVGYDGLSEVNINKINTETITVQSTNETQTETPPENYYYDGVVILPPTTEPKTVDITENGTTTITPSEAGVFFDNVTVNVNVPAPQPVKPKDYNFFDWDGTLLYAYSADEINALTELPALPIHEGLTSEWNYTLAQLQSLTQLARPLPANVGCIVKTLNGSTMFEIEIPEGDTKRNVDLNFPCSADSTAVVDWGDGSTETVTATGSYIAQSHIYADNTTYTIKIDFTSGSYALNANLPILGTTPRQCGYLRKVVLGTSNLNVGSGYVCRTFNNQYNLEVLSFGGAYSSTNTLQIPRNFTAGCSKLKAIHLPVGTIMINAYALQSNAASVVTLPIGITNIDFATFTGMVNLKYLTLPSSLSNLGAYPFGSSGLEKLIITDSVINSGTWFQYAPNISYIELPTALTSIPANFMSLTQASSGEGATINKLKIPSSVTSIGYSAFSLRKGILVFDFSECTAVPTLANINAFNSINDYAVILVPDNLYEEWIAATNWATYAARIVKASEYDD